MAIIYWHIMRVILSTLLFGAMITPVQSEEMRWTFEAMDGGIVADATGNGHDGTVVGGTIISGGTSGNGLSLDSAGSSVEAASLHGVSFPRSGTLLFWIKGNLSGQANYASILDSYHEQRNHIFIRVLTGTSQGIQIAFQPTAAQPYVFYALIPLTDNEWHQIGVVWDTVSDRAIIYVDGEQVSDKAIDSAWSPDGQVMTFGNGVNGFIGNLDEVHLTSEILNAEEIKDYYRELKGLPLIHLTTDRDVLLDGQTATIQWEIENAEHWEAKGDWSEDLAQSGTYTVSNLRWNKTYRIAAYGAGESIGKSVTIRYHDGAVLRTQHPFLFVDADLLERIAVKKTDLSIFHQHVKNTFEKNANTLDQTEEIWEEILPKCEAAHISAYQSHSLYYGMDAYLNNDPLSKAYAQAYLQCLNNRDPAFGEDDGPPRGKVLALGILYDWLYDELSDETKAATRTAILEQIEYLDAQEGFYTSPLFSGGHSRAANTAALAGLLAIQHDITEDERAIYQEYFTRVKKNFEAGYNPTQRWIAEGGGYHIGWSYSFGGYIDKMPYLLWKYATAEPGWLESWQDETFYLLLYGLRNLSSLSDNQPDGYDTWPYWGDVWGTLYGAIGQGLDMLVPDYLYGNPDARWLYQQLTPKHATSYWDILYNHSDGESATSPQSRDLPLSRWFGNSGFVLMRDSWNVEQNTLLTFKSTPFYTDNHHHKDQNAFTLYYNGPLAIDSGGYNVMGAYGSIHWQNYYTRTIAHNTLVFYDPDECFKWGKDEQQCLSSQERNSNDGGQKFFANGYPTLEQMMEGGSHHFDGITGYEHNGIYTYASGDATKAYSAGKLERFIRHVVYLRNHSYSHPVVVVYDDAVTTEPEYEKSYVLHSIGEPDIDLSKKLVTIKGDDGRDPNKRSILYHQTLLPEDAELSKIGGTEFGRFYVRDDGAGNPHNYVEGLKDSAERSLEDERALREAGEWRIEVKPGTQREVDRFLHVLSIADGGENYDAVHTEYLGSDEFDGAIVVDPDGAERSAVLFCRVEELEDASIDLTGREPFSDLLLIGLKKETRYDVRQEGSFLRIQQDVQGNALSSKQGLIYKTVSHPEISIQQGAQEIAVGDSFNVGICPPGNSLAVTFTIFNSGSDDLTLNGDPIVKITDEHAYEFTVTQQPATPVASGDSTTFTIKFTPTVTGMCTTAISIDNNDSDENPYTFTVTGTGQAAASQNFLLWTK